MTLLVLLQMYVSQRQFQELPEGVRAPLIAITDGLEGKQDPALLRPQFEALIEGLTQNYDEVQTLDNRFNRVLVLSIGVLVVLSMMLAFFLARRISGPITAVAGAAERIAEGDLSARRRTAPLRPPQPRRNRDAGTPLQRDGGGFGAARARTSGHDRRHRSRTPHPR